MKPRLCRHCGLPVDALIHAGGHPERCHEFEGGVRSPKRIQLSRRKGYRKPAGAVIVSRPSKWGNPWKLTDRRYQSSDGSPAPFNEDDARAKCVRDFEGALEQALEILPFTVADVLRELRGKDLACWCPLSKACHADVLLRIANGPIEAATREPGR